ncbi:MAG: phenylacetate--CoA ligase family protein [Chloroflexi bacterium]|nr:phenylacetate--CoA ligase family protein [Chloroflexota bacterium]
MLAREAAFVALSYVRQYGDAERLAQARLRRLDDMLSYCRAHVPFYRDDRYDVGPLLALSDLSKLPLITKQDLRTCPREDFLARGVDVDRCWAHGTSGTTGQRITAIHDLASFDYHTATGVRRFLASGHYKPTDRLSHLRPFVPPRRTFERFGLFRRHVILSHLDMSEVKRQLLANRPQVIVGYPTHLRDVLRALTEGELRALRGSLRAIYTESELLIEEHRRLLSDGFGVPVFDEYSAFEVLSVAYECRHHGFHVAEDRIQIEIVDEAGRALPDGTEGAVVVTSFMERAMPLMRYALGDVGTIETRRCRCGRRFRTMRLTKGRSEGVVVLPSGRRLYPSTFLHLAATEPGVDECYVRQAGDGSLTLHVVPNEAERPLPATAAAIEEVLQRLAGEPLSVTVVAADRVALTAGGKGAFVASEYRGTPVAM